MGTPNYKLEQHFMSIVHEQNPLVGETFSGFLPLLTAAGSTGMLMMKLKDMRMGTFKGMTALDKKVGRTGTGSSSAAGKVTAICMGKREKSFRIVGTNLNSRSFPSDRVV